MTEPFKEILSRNSGNLKGLLNEWGNLLEEIVNFGTWVLKWCNDNAKGGEENIPLIFSFRHILEILDAISVFVRNLIVQPAEILLRCIFEALLSINYILQADTERRALCFNHAHLHRKLFWYRRLDPNSSEGKIFLAELKKDPVSKNMRIPNPKELPTAIKNIENMLSKPQYKIIEQEWISFRRAQKRRPEWFSLYGGPNNIQELSRQLNYSAWYEILYRSWSAKTHSLNVIDSLTVDRTGAGAISGLRNPAGIKQIITFAIPLAIKAFRSILTYYDTSKLRELEEWYINNIREPYLRIAIN